MLLYHLALLYTKLNKADNHIETYYFKSRSKRFPFLAQICMINGICSYVCLKRVEVIANVEGLVKGERSLPMLMVLRDRSLPMLILSGVE